MPVTRRTIWMNDEDWAEMQRRSERAGMTVSAWLRAGIKPQTRPTAGEGEHVKPDLARALTNKA